MLCVPLSVFKGLLPRLSSASHTSVVFFFFSMQLLKLFEIISLQCCRVNAGHRVGLNTVKLFDG